MNKHEPYNGWSNYFTWNVALWLGNDEGLYSLVTEYTKRQQKAGYSLNYDEFLLYAGIPTGTKTPDGVAFHSSNVNRNEMREVLAEV
jgi:hypothetical protein